MNQQNPPYVFFFDWDRTLGQTHLPSPNGWNVEKAYTESIRSIFGQDVLNIYLQQNGLKNRAPLEVVSALFNLVTDELRASMIERGRNLFIEKGEDLMDLIPEGKGFPFVWNPEQPVYFFTELLCRVKLNHLRNEINSEWPLPYDGVIEMFETIKSLKRAGILIYTGIVSSAHEIAIEDIFGIYGLELPDVLVTDDDIRGMQLPEFDGFRVKPGPLPLALAYQQLEKLRGSYDRVSTPILEEHMFFAGDDPDKDGKMARLGGVADIHFAEGSKIKGLEISRGGWSVKISNWNEFTQFLLANQEKLREGKPLHQNRGVEGNRPSGIEGYLRRGKEG